MPLNFSIQDQVTMERSTRQRSAIRDAISQADRPLLPHEVLILAQANVPNMGIATVYRNLKLMVDDGELKPVLLPGDTARYELSDHDHHHHFQCTKCERVFDVHACPGNLGQLAPKGFTVDHHDLTLYGRCSDCQPSTRKSVYSHRLEPKPQASVRPAKKSLM